MKKILSLYFLFFLCLTANGQTLASRVVAFARYGADTTVPSADSGGYKYAPGKGGEILCGLNELQCDYPFVIEATTDFETGYHGLVKSDSSWETRSGDTDITIQFFDANNNTTYVLSKMFSDGVWGNYSSQTNTYDTNNNLVQQIDTSWVADCITYTFTYDDNNRVTQQTYLAKTSVDSSDWWRGTKTVYTYDASGNLSMAKSYPWQKEPNSFSNVSNFTTLFSYRGEQPDTFKDNYANGATDGVYYFSPANDTMIVDFYSFIADSSYLRITNTYDGHHNKTSSTQLELDIAARINSFKRIWSYNAFDQVTCEWDYNLDSSGNWAFAGLTRFYYETYYPEVPFSANNLSVFPSPAKSSITVKLEWAAPQPFTCGIFDAAGRRVMQWNVPSVQKYEQNINLKNVSPGNYFFRAAAGKQKLAKQFVVLD